MHTLHTGRRERQEERSNTDVWRSSQIRALHRWENVFWASALETHPAVPRWRQWRDGGWAAGCRQLPLPACLERWEGALQKAVCLSRTVPKNSPPAAGLRNMLKRTICRRKSSPSGGHIHFIAFLQLLKLRQQEKNLLHMWNAAWKLGWLWAFLGIVRGF